MPIKTGNLKLTFHQTLMLKDIIVESLGIGAKSYFEIETLIYLHNAIDKISQKLLMYENVESEEKPLTISTEK